MKPYYSESGITIYHADCREVLPSLPDDSVDLLLTDPPYGVSWQSNYRQKAFSEIMGDHSTEAAEIGVGLSLRVMRNGRHGYVFGRYAFEGLPLAGRTELIWDKVNMNCGNLMIPWGNQHEYIQFFVSVKSEQNRIDGKGKLSARLRRGTVLQHLRPNATAVSLHPTEKPVMLLRELIESSSCIGETVLDPFMGSGSTMKACEIEGRRAIGIEIEEKYCEIAANRLRQEVFAFPREGTERSW